MIKKKITLAELMGERLKQKEPTSFKEIQTVYALLSDKKGIRTAKLVLVMFGIKTLEKLKKERYDQFVTVCKLEMFKD